MNLAEELRAASADPPPTSIDLDRLVAREERRRVRARWLAAGCAVAVAVTATVIGVRAATDTHVEPRVEYAWSPDSLPALDTLPGVADLWPGAVHRLPAKLPNGGAYIVHAVLGDDRYLVGVGSPSDPNAPAVFDTRAGTVTPLAPPSAFGGVAEGRVLMARVAGDHAVWMLEGFRANKDFRELWAARLDGGGAQRLAQLRDGVPPRFTVAGDGVVWSQDIVGSRDDLKPPFTRVWRVPIAGGPARELPGSTGFDTADDGPWFTTQVLASGVTASDQGRLWNPATGEQRSWKAHRSVQFLECGPVWCSGAGPGDRVALQRLDGTGYIELPYGGELRSAREGRLAVGSLRSSGVTAQVVWDRQTGRAGTVTRTENSDEPRTIVPGQDRATSFGLHSSDFDRPVETWRAGEHLMVLDLGAIG